MMIEPNKSYLMMSTLYPYEWGHESGCLFLTVMQLKLSPTRHLTFFIFEF